MTTNQNQVKVTADAAGNIVCGGTVSTKDGKTYGYIRVQSEETTTSPEGWIRSDKRSALIKGEIDSLKAWVAQNNIRVGSTLPGRIQIQESLVPSYPTQKPKRAGADGPELHKDGKPIYRNTFYLTPNIDKPDVLIEHDNVLSSSAQVSPEAKKMQPNPIIN